MQRVPGENFFPTLEAAKERAAFTEQAHQRRREQLKLDYKRSVLIHLLKSATFEELDELNSALEALRQ